MMERKGEREDEYGWVQQYTNGTVTVSFIIQQPWAEVSESKRAWYEECTASYLAVAYDKTRGKPKWNGD